MSRKTLELVAQVKDWIEDDNTDCLFNLALNIEDQVRNEECYISWEYVFQQAYLHASLKNKQEIKDWLEGMYNEFNPVTKIGMKPMLSYAKYLKK